MNCNTNRPEEVIYSLLHDRSLREVFCSGDWSSLAFDPELERDLRAIDQSELAKMGNLILREALSGADARDAGLQTLFGRTFDELSDLGLSNSDLVSRFLASAEYCRAGNLPLNNERICMEEAFYHYTTRLAGEIDGAEHVRSWAKHEFLSGFLPILVTNPQPAFSTETSGVKNNGTCRYCAVEYPSEVFETAVGRPPSQRNPEYVLYASARGTFIQGPISETALRLIEAEAIGETAENYRDDVGLKALAEKLAKLGLIQP